jgi:hypothetical protein
MHIFHCYHYIGEVDVVKKHGRFKVIENKFKYECCKCGMVKLCDPDYIGSW